MFGFFRKKAMDMEAAESFWNWFVENEEWIKTYYKEDPYSVVMAMNDKITPVFPYFKKQLEFEFGYIDGKGEFSFFHMGNQSLLRDGEILRDMMPDTLRAHWTFVLEE